MNKVQTNTPIRCLVMQLGRLSDTLQSLMALRAAKTLYPQLEIHLLVRDSFSATAAKRVPWIQNVSILPTDQFLRPVLEGQNTVKEMTTEVARWLLTLAQEPWDFLVNWTFSEASSHLARVIPAQLKIGYTRHDDLSFAAVDGWTQYIQSIVQTEVSQNIHITDLLTTQLLTALQIQLGDGAPAGDAAVTSKTFFSLTLSAALHEKIKGEAARKYVAVQLSSESSFWNAKNIGKVIQLILERHPHYGVFLLGDSSEVADAESILKNLDKVRGKERVISLVGQTDFDLWTATISRCQWMMTEKGAAAHLASLLGVRVLHFPVSTTKFMETGPYGHGHYVLTLDEKGSQEPEARFTAEGIYIVWSFAINEWYFHKQTTLEDHFENLSWKSHLESLRVYRSRIRDTQDGGGVTYDLAVQKPLTFSEWTAGALGHIARLWYCGWAPACGQGLTRENLSPALIQNVRELNESVQFMNQVLQKAQATAETLAHKGASLKSKKIMSASDRAELRDLSSTLLELDQLIERIAATSPALLIFSNMLKVLMHNLGGELLADMGKATQESYKQLQAGVKGLTEWIQSSLNLMKPMALKQNRSLQDREIPEIEI